MLPWMSTEPRGTLVEAKLSYHFSPSQSLFVSEAEFSPNSQVLDLELATSDYRPRAMAEKAAAGFLLYGRSDDASRLRGVLDECELTAVILSL